ncbi:hypothetical protein KP509_25G060100 [Ceratopteris richardii]|nr:hypothetical protein KP509_25G060100 [Ceratopteris richardii]
MVPIGPVILSVGDTVHIRCVESGRSKTPLQDMLSYSCLAILRAYFPKTEGLRSYTFYRSLNGTKVAGLGVWQDAITASSFLNAPDGACEESFWRSMGATTRFEIYEVATLVE